MDDQDVQMDEVYDEEDVKQNQVEEIERKHNTNDEMEQVQQQERRKLTKEEKQAKRKADEDKYGSVGIDEHSIELNFDTDADFPRGTANRLNNNTNVIHCSPPNRVKIVTKQQRRVEMVILRISCNKPRQYSESYPKLIQEVHRLFGKHVNVYTTIPEKKLLSRKGKLFIGISCESSEELNKLIIKIQESNTMDAFGGRNTKITLESDAEHANNHHSMLLKNVATSFRNTDLLVAFNNLNRENNLNIVGFKRYFSYRGRTKTPQRIVQVWCGDTNTYNTLCKSTSLYYSDCVMVPEQLNIQQTGPQEERRKPIICYNCQNSGHTAKLCFKHRTCKFCLSTKHHSNNCPRKKHPVCRLCGKEHLTGHKTNCTEYRRIQQGQKREFPNGARDYLRKLQQKENRLRNSKQRGKRQKSHENHNKSQENHDEYVQSRIQSKKKPSRNLTIKQRSYARAAKRMLVPIDDQQDGKHVESIEAKHDNASDDWGNWEHDDNMWQMKENLQPILVDERPPHQDHLVNEVDQLKKQVQDLTSQIKEMKQLIMQLQYRPRKRPRLDEQRHDNVSNNNRGQSVQVRTKQQESHADIEMSDTHTRQQNEDRKNK
jgi:hypothetical protein